MNEKNKFFLNSNQNKYPSLKYFSIDNNRLSLNNGKNIFFVYIPNVDLSSLNPTIYLSSPNQLINILYMIELLYHKTLQDTEINFINSYIQNYLKYNDSALNDKTVNHNLLISLSIPIYLSYSEEFINNPASQLIFDKINSYNTEIEDKMNKSPRLVLKNNNFDLEKVEDPVENFEKAGFTTIALITLGIITACTIVASYIFTH